jgi:hypothetical protein
VLLVTVASAADEGITVVALVIVVWGVTVVVSVLVYHSL